MSKPVLNSGFGKIADIRFQEQGKIDIDKRSQYYLLYCLEPLAYLHKRKVIRVSNLKVYSSPSGKGWHVRYSVLTPFNVSILNLIGGDDIWRATYNLECKTDTLFSYKEKNGVVGVEKFNSKLTKRARGMFK